MKFIVFIAAYTEAANYPETFLSFYSTLDANKSDHELFGVID